MRTKKRLVAEDRRETHFSSNEEKEKWIKIYVESSGSNGSVFGPFES
jgi:hypothetical protein